MNVELTKRLTRRCSAAAAVATAMALYGCGDAPTAGDNGTATAQPAAQTTSATTTADAAEGATTIVYNVTGMHCDACAQAINSAVGKLAGVQSCTASFEQGIAEVVVNDPQASAQIMQAVAKLGYTIEPKPEDES